MNESRLPLAIVREYIVSPYSSKTEADIAWEALDQIEAALRLMIQYGVDEDDQVWIAPNPAGVGRAAGVLGIDAKFVREALGA